VFEGEGEGVGCGGCVKTGAHHGRGHTYFFQVEHREIISTVQTRTTICNPDGVKVFLFAIKRFLDVRSACFLFLPLHVILGCQDHSQAEDCLSQDLYMRHPSVVFALYTTIHIHPPLRAFLFVVVFAYNVYLDVLYMIEHGKCRVRYWTCIQTMHHYLNSADRKGSDTGNNKMEQKSQEFD